MKLSTSNGSSGFGVHEWQRQDALRLLTIYREKVLTHIFPAFAGVATEAEHVEREAFDALRARLDPATGDESLLVEHAKDLGTAHFIDLERTLQGVVNGAIANLYHFAWESPVREWLRRSRMLTSTQRTKVESGEFQKTVKVMAALGWNGPDDVMATIGELRLVANTVKHARGSAAQVLFARRRNLFYPFDLVGKDEHWDYEPDGADLIPGEDDFELYVAALRSFWSAIPEADPAF